MTDVLQMSAKTPGRNEEDLDSLLGASNNLDRRRRRSSKPLPPQFRPEMPTTGRKSPPKDLISHRPNFGMAGKSFYGGSVPKPNFSLRKREPPSAPENPKSAKRSKKTKSDSGTKKTAVAPRNLRSTDQRKKSKYEMNKAVSHNIKPPKKPKPAPEKKEVKPTTTPKNKNVKLFKMTPGRVGNLSSSVDYVIKNGQYQFLRRRSPRKSNLTSPMLSPSTPIQRKTPKLFTPRGQKDFLSPSSTSPGYKRAGKCLIPSPIKFDAGDEDDEMTGHDISSSVNNVIDSIGDDKPTQNYAVEVTDDELAEIAKNAAMEVADLGIYEDFSQEYADLGEMHVISYEDAVKSQDVNKENVGTRRTSPRKKPQSINNTPKKATPRKCSPRKTTPRKGYLTPLKSNALNSPSKDSPRTRSSCHRAGSAKASSSKRLFPVFGKGAKTGIEEDSQDEGSPSLQYTKKKFHLKGDDSQGQSIIDAGQKVIGNHSCPTCGFLYNPSYATEEKLHEIEHKKYLGIVRFPGWRRSKEYLVLDDPLCKIYRVKKGDPEAHWTLALSVLEVVDKFLGVNHGLRQKDKSEVYLCIVDKNVAGCLVIEPLTTTDKLAVSMPQGNTRVAFEGAKRMPRPEQCLGVSRIWVQESHQRKGLAMKMMNSFQWQHHHVKKDKIAFSHTTDSGTAFATKFFQNNKFLIYTPH